MAKGNMALINIILKVHNPINDKMAVMRDTKAVLQ
jgi:hypothetical protein